MSKNEETAPRRSTYVPEGTQPIEVPPAKPVETVTYVNTKPNIVSTQQGRDEVKLSTAVEDINIQVSASGINILVESLVEGHGSPLTLFMDGTAVYGSLEPTTKENVAALQALADARSEKIVELHQVIDGLKEALDNVTREAAETQEANRILTEEEDRDIDEEADPEDRRGMKPQLGPDVPPLDAFWEMAQGILHKHDTGPVIAVADVSARGPVELAGYIATVQNVADEMQDRANRVRAYGNSLMSAAQLVDIHRG